MMFLAILSLALIGRYAIGAAYGWDDIGDIYNDAYKGATSQAGIDLGNAADALGINYDEAKNTGGTIAGAYLGAGYGAGLGNLGLGVTGSQAAGAGVGGVAGNAAMDYVLRPDGTFVKKDTAKYAASDEYGGYDQAKRDWFYNQEQAHGKGWTKDEFKLAQAQYDDQNRRNERVGAINNWEQSRNPYYAALYQDKVKTAQATNQQAYADSMKRMQLQHAARGTLGGSQSTYNSAQIGAAKALRDSQAAQAAQNDVQGLRRSDQNLAGNMRMQQSGTSDYMKALSEAMNHSENIKGGSYGAMGNLEQLKNQDEQQYQNGMSQIYGQAIGNGMGGAATMLGGMG